MGLIKVMSDIGGAALNSASATLHSGLWTEYFESGDMSNGIIMKRGDRITSNGSKNKQTDDNLISSGSGIDVQPGQCAIIVENGRVVEFSAEPGRYTYDSSTAPSLLCGENKGLKAMIGEFKKQLSAGGQRFSTQRIYFINMGEMIYTPIKWGVGEIPFHHYQNYSNGTIELDMLLKGNGQFTVQIADPLKFFNSIGAQKVGADTSAVIRISEDGILSSLKTAVMGRIAEAVTKVGQESLVSYNDLNAKKTQIANHINEALTEEWAGKRGFVIASFDINGSFVPSDEDMEAMRAQQERLNIVRNIATANYDIQKTMAEGFKEAGKNGGTSGLFGMGLATSQMGAMAGFGNMAQPTYGTNNAPTIPATLWGCTCGAQNEGNFCHRCGAKKPNAVGAQEPGASWKCECGEENSHSARFCPSCGAKKPATRKIVCNQCGWTPAPGQNVKFCPQCGDIFNDADYVEI